jgi:large subunit ribosomal protein L24
MKSKFSTKWKASKQPRKQRKYLANAPIHVKRKMLAVNLDKKLREKLKKRNAIVRKDDEVKIMRGKFKGQKGKILEVFTKQGKVTIEGIQVKKTDGSKVLVKLQPSNLQIITLVDRGKVKTKKKGKKEKVEEKKEIKKKDSKEKVEEKKKSNKKPKEKTK